MVKYIVILAAIGAFIWYGNSQYRAGENAERVFWQQRYIDSNKAAEKRSQDAQNRLTAQHQEQYNEMQSINDNLLADNHRLRDRADRMPETSRAACQGASGAELSRDDSEFLVWLGAECERMRVNLKTHYQYVDEVMGLYQ